MNAKPHVQILVVPLDTFGATDAGLRPESLNVQDVAIMV